MEKYKLMLYKLMFLLFLADRIQEVSDTVYPDTYNECDPLYLKDAMDAYFYEAGKFRAGRNIYVKKYNILFYSKGVTGLDYNFAKEILTVDESYYKYRSELQELFEEGVNMDGASIRMPFQYLYSGEFTGPHSLTMRLPIYSRNNGGMLSVTINYLFSCTFTGLQQGLNCLRLTITSNSIQCEGGGSSLWTGTDNFGISLKFNVPFDFGGNDVYGSHYLMTLNSNSGYDNFTYNFYHECNLGGNSRFGNDCIPGFYCQRDRFPNLQSLIPPDIFKNTCHRCDSPCIECHNGCLCNILTEKNFDDNGKLDGGCKHDYVDISNYGDFDVVGLTPPRTYRLTIGLWVFFGRDTDARFFQIIGEHFFYISISPSKSQATIRCTVFEKYNPEYGGKTPGSSDIPELSIISTTTTYDRISDLGLSGHWFYVQCGMSVHHREFYLSTRIDGEEFSYQKKNLTEVLYGNTNSIDGSYMNDWINRHIYLNGNTFTLQFRNTATIGKKLYIKNLVVFQEYMPHDLLQLYYDWSEIITRRQDFPELILVIPFVEKRVNPWGNGIIVDYWDNGKKELNIPYKTDNPLEIAALDWDPPYNFKRLYLSTTANCLFKDLKLKEQTHCWTFAEPRGNYFLDVECNKTFAEHKYNIPEYNCPIACSTGHYVFFDGKTYVCTDTNCDPPEEQCTDTYCKAYTHITYPGLDPNNKGYCNYEFERTLINTQTVDHMIEDASSEKNTFCKPGYTDLFYKCATEKDDYVLYYNGYFNNAGFTIRWADLSGSYAMDNYFIEFWYYPDYTRIINSEGHSNGGKIFEFNNIVITCENIVECSIGDNKFILSYDWNHILLKVEDGILLLILNGNIFTPQIIDSTFTGAMNSIRFTTDWYTGFYKNIRLWDGKNSYFYSNPQYDEMFGDLNSRMYGIKLFYPLTQIYFADNIITSPDGISPEVKIDNDPSWNPWNIQLINFSSRFDYIKIACPSLNQYVTRVPTAGGIPRVEDCPDECERCWENIGLGSKCYQCKPDYYLSCDFRCRKAERYYLRSPPTTVIQDIKIREGIVKMTNNQITLTFWLKVFGFSKETSEVVTFNNIHDDTFYLFYDGTQGSGRLSLIYKEDGKDHLITYDDYFFQKLGQWVFISIAIYNEKTEEYFPPMVHFEIDTTSFDIDYDEVYSIKSFDVNTFIISKNVYGLFYNLKIYTEYIVGAYHFESNVRVPKTPYHVPPLVGGVPYFPTGTTPTNCYNDTDFNDIPVKLKCVPDFEPRFTPLADGEKYYYMTYDKIRQEVNPPNTCHSYCINMCYKSSTLNVTKDGDPNNRNLEYIPGGCTCTIQNYNTQMFEYFTEKYDYKNKGNNKGLKKFINSYCRRFEFLNWAKSEDVIIDPVETAELTKKFTLQFWMFAYTYVPGKFGGATILWNGHSMIKIKPGDTSDKYVYECYPSIIDGEVIDDTTEKVNLTYKIGEWVFVSCATNLLEDVLRFYFNMATDKPIDRAQGALEKTNKYRYKGNTTYLLFRDDTETDEWGILHYRQIRLWKEAFEFDTFHRTIDIQTPSLFDNLLHMYETYFNVDDDDLPKSVSDRAGTGGNITIKNRRLIGVNLVHRFPKLTLVSENGEFLAGEDDGKEPEGEGNDGKRVQFVDYGQVPSFRFNAKLDVSKNGNYAIAFWIFSENYPTFNSGFNILWTKHMQISVLQEDSLSVYCFPTEYYTEEPETDLLPKQKMTTAINAGKYSLGQKSGEWVWVICSVSNYMEKFMINDDDKNFPLKHETLYKYGKQEGKAIFPYRFFMSNQKQSELHIFHKIFPKKFYMRTLYVFRDYIPYSYEYKYIDLYRMQQNHLPALVFSCDFATVSDLKKEKK